VLSDLYFGNQQYSYSYLYLQPVSVNRGSAVGIRAGRLRDRGSSPGSLKNFLSSTSSGPAMGSNQSPIQWVWGGSFSGGEAEGA
jgi:hypothetical protein